MRTPHQARIVETMLRAEQVCPLVPTMPDQDTRRLRARLILEEALETVTALGFRAVVNAPAGFEERHSVTLAPGAPPDMAEIADGCVDISVVTMGTLAACGLRDEPLLVEVDEANLRKFVNGCIKDEGGKYLKPPGWVGPAIEDRLRDQGWQE